MPRVIDSPDQFVIIGENIHTTRMVRRGGVRSHTFEDGTEAIKYRVDGEERYVRVPEHFTRTQPYEQGNLKHFMIAVWKGVYGDEEEAAEGKAYIEYEAKRQIRAGADYLDLNVDEASYRLNEQKESMEWLVKFVQSVSTVPLSIDSSNAEIIETGLAAYDGSRGRPMLNSVALERLDALDLVLEHDARCIVTAAAEDRMPSNAEERLENVGKIVETALSKGIAKEDIFVDPLFFPISVDSTYGQHALGAIRLVRDEFGDEIHVTGGMSNVSFGLPRRRLVNDAFLHLAIEAGADSGIIDPIQTRVDRVLELDMESKPVKMAVDLLMGNDDFAMNYITAYRAGELDE